MSEDWAHKKATKIISEYGNAEFGAFAMIRNEIAQALREAVAAEMERCAQIAEGMERLGVAQAIRNQHD